MTLDQSVLKDNFLALHTEMTGIKTATEYAEVQLAVYQDGYAVEAQLPPIVIGGEDFSDSISLASVGDISFKSNYATIYGVISGVFITHITTIASAYAQYWSESMWLGAGTIIGIVEIGSVQPNAAFIATAKAALIQTYLAMVLSFDPASSMTAEQGAELQATMFDTFTKASGVIVSGTIHLSWVPPFTVPDVPFSLPFPLT